MGKKCKKYQLWNAKIALILHNISKFDPQYEKRKINSLQMTTYFDHSRHDLEELRRRGLKNKNMY